MADTARAARSRYFAFIRQVAQTQEVWGLKSAEGWANSTSGLQPGAIVMPFWSDRTRAAAAARDAWAAYQPTLIPLDKFLIRWLPNMAAEGALVGPDWESTELSGYEAPAVDIQRRLLKKLDGDLVLELHEKAERDQKGKRSEPRSNPSLAQRRINGENTVTV